MSGGFDIHLGQIHLLLQGSLPNPLLETAMDEASFSSSVSLPPLCLSLNYALPDLISAFRPIEAKDLNQIETDADI